MELCAIVERMQSDEEAQMVNGVLEDNVLPGAFHRIRRTWSPNDNVTLNFPMTLKASRWVAQSVAIERGPLVYSLQIKERWRGPDLLRNGETLGAGVNLLQVMALGKLSPQRRGVMP